MSVYLGNFDRAVRKRALQPKMVAAYGFALGVLAFWLTIPPFTTRSPIWPVLVGILATLAGVYAVTREARRAGWGAVVVGVIGIGLGIFFVSERARGEGVGPDASLSNAPA